jgi:Fur family zinc uptake transcriptional regulator
LRADGRSAAPPTVYRALEFLLEQGLVHRVESLNAYIGCTHPGERHATQFLICGRCGTAVELDDPRIAAAIDTSAARLGFEVGARTVEVAGTCAGCRT